MNIQIWYYDNKSQVKSLCPFLFLSISGFFEQIEDLLIFLYIMLQ